MRRKSTRNTTKSTPPEQPVEPVRRSSRTSARLKKSPVKFQQDSDEDNVNLQTLKERPREKTVCEKTAKTIAKPIEDDEKLVENVKNDDDSTENIKNETSDSNTAPPQIEISTTTTGNDEPVNDEVRYEKGKSKGIKAQVEEKSEITMNSVASGSTEDTIIVSDKISVEPEVNDPQKDNSNNDVSLEQNDDESNIKKPEDENNDSIQETNISSEQLTETQESNIPTETQSEIAPEIENENTETITELSFEEKDVTMIEVFNNKNEETEEGEIVGSKSDDETEPRKTESPVKKTPVKIKLRRDSLFETIEQRDENNQEITSNKLKWNLNDVHKCLQESELFTLGAEDFKALSSDLKLADEKDIRMEETYPRLPRERTLSTNDEKVENNTTLSSDEQENSNLIGLNRKISIVDDSASKLRPPPSPARQPVSPILYISNLVRPFTIKQLRELLERTGAIKEDGFWTDRIKSKCYVQYEQLEDAEATRNALHGVNWPIGNGKKLIIEFATEEDMEKARNPPKEVVVAAPAPVVQTSSPKAKTPQKENKEPSSDTRNGERQQREEIRRRESEKVRATTREWDIGKETLRNRSRSRSRERKRKHSGRRSVTPLEDFIARKQRKMEEAVPQKLMDDLFLKTKTMPCIYWQPLSPDEISVKQQQRLTRMEEHKKRLKENSSRGVPRNNRGGREQQSLGRGSYRRRYD